jgi:hypothetical protein
MYFNLETKCQLAEVEVQEAGCFFAKDSAPVSSRSMVTHALADVPGSFAGVEIL